MDLTNRKLWRAGLALAVAVSAAVPAATQGTGEVPVLARLERGLWQLRLIDGGRNALAPVCIGDPAILTQLQHRDRRCSRSVVSTGRDSVAVRYSCPELGLGLTTIRVETPRLARIESEGVDNGVPFGFRAEARRVGACG